MRGRIVCGVVAIALLIMAGLALATVLTGCKTTSEPKSATGPALSKGVAESGSAVGAESKTIGKASSTIRVETKSVEAASPKSAGVIAGQCDVLDKSAAALAVIEGQMLALQRACVELETANGAAIDAIAERDKKIADLQDANNSRLRGYLTIGLFTAIGIAALGVGIIVGVPNRADIGLTAATVGATGAGFCWTFLSRAGVWLGWAIAAVIFAAVAYAVVMFIRRKKAEAGDAALLAAEQALKAGQAKAGIASVATAVDAVLAMLPAEKVADAKSILLQRQESDGTKGIVDEARGK